MIGQGNNQVIGELSEYSEDEMKQEVMNAELNDLIGGYLCKVYPGYPWGVHSDVRNGVVNVFINIGHGGRAPYGVTVRITSSAHGLLSKCKHFCGELLERYGFNRGAMVEKEVQDAMSNADFAGRIKIDEA